MEVIASSPNILKDYLLEEDSFLLRIFCLVDLKIKNFI